MTSMFALTGGLLVLLGASSLQAVAQSISVDDAAVTAVPVAPFRSVQLRHGGTAILRHGPTQRVSFLKGSPDDVQLTIAQGDELVIEKRKGKCQRPCELEIEIVTPGLTRVTVAQGGTIESRGSFPRQGELGLTVDNGGTIDVRTMSAGTVTASVLSGGRIFVKPLTAMVATVLDGGNITYWGDAEVRQSIRKGGVIERETDEPLRSRGL